MPVGPQPAVVVPDDHLLDVSHVGALDHKVVDLAALEAVGFGGVNPGKEAGVREVLKHQACLRHTANHDAAMQSVAESSNYLHAQRPLDLLVGRRLQPCLPHRTKLAVQLDEHVGIRARTPAQGTEGSHCTNPPSCATPVTLKTRVTATRPLLPHPYPDRRTHQTIPSPPVQPTPSAPVHPPPRPYTVIKAPVILIRTPHLMSEV